MQMRHVYHHQVSESKFNNKPISKRVEALLLAGVLLKECSDYAELHSAYAPLMPAFYTDRTQ